MGLDGGLMARIKFKGLQEYEVKLSKLAANSREIAGQAIYIAADIVADAVKEAIEALPVDENYGTHDKKSHGIKQIQKDGLIDSWGISQMRDDQGFYNVKLGFDGYNGLKTQGHPSGQPNQMIARAVESGTTFSDKIPFVRPAVNASKARAEKAMVETLDEEINKIMD